LYFLDMPSKVWESQLLQAICPPEASQSLANRPGRDTTARQSFELHAWSQGSNHSRIHFIWYNCRMMRGHQ
jgi:hypothetical protein